MSADRVTIVEQNLDRQLAELTESARLLAADQPLRPGSSLTAARARDLFEDMVLSRTIDIAARALKARGEGFYTISSAGHELNATLGALLRPTDPCLLHYRSGALFASRLRQIPGSTPSWDVLLSLTASAEDPASGGRHKVWGSRGAWIPPQTSTIASHLPKAVGMAFAIGRARRLEVRAGLPLLKGLPKDSIVMCSFGDASSNHATALSGINAARWGKRRGNPMPVLFVCEDNKRGISVETPSRWVQDTWDSRRHLHFFDARGEVDEVWDTVELAIRTCRQQREPVFLRLDSIRLWGHAGSDVESAYRSLKEIEHTESRDPILAASRRLTEVGAATPAQLKQIVASTRARVTASMEEATQRPKLTDVDEILRPLAPVEPELWQASATRAIAEKDRREVFGRRLPEEEASSTRRTLAARINQALHDEMLRHPEMVLFGEDVGRKGGVYGVSQHLQERFGQARCFDTLLDETTILGVAQGAAQVGLLPILEIQYLAYLHNAIDQLRGEACSTSYFSNGAFQNPMVVRIAGLGYQKGFGGHFHNDNSIGALREIPGLAMACPARGDDAVRMLRGAVAMASESGRVVTFLEPIALYHERDLYADGDEKWLCDYPAPNGSAAAALLPGEVGVYNPEASDVLIISYANGLRMSLRAARRLEAEIGKRARVMDLRWLNPLPHEALRKHAEECGRVLVVDECRATGAGVADAIIAALAEAGFVGRMKSVRGLDCYIPLADAANLIMLSEEQIYAAAMEVSA
ncbi:MAG: MFS transporter [Planctomycetes bacterium]|nr:MFS transporter [Planctomycetota bacterium]